VPDTQLSRGALVALCLRRYLAGLVVLGLLLFAPAGTLRYWEAWTYLAILFVPMGLVFVWLLRHDPVLLERRMRTKEKDQEQSLLIRLGSLCYLLAFLAPGFDRRFGWSDLPTAAVVAADVLVLLGYGCFVLVLRENSYASRVVEVEREQRVVTTGPYAVVRHPMYVAILVMFLFTPLALGSWWGLLPTLPLVAVIVARIRNEERMLVKDLVGYADYVRVTRYRLVPGVW